VKVKQLGNMMTNLLTSNSYNSHKTDRIKKLQKQLSAAESYIEWKEIALQLDETTGTQEWKFDNASPYFDAEVISHRLVLLRKYRQQNRIKDLIYILREGLTYDIANICHPMLFVECYIG
jgi:NTE family protein